MRQVEGDKTQIEEEKAIQVQRPKLELCSHMPGDMKTCRETPETGKGQEGYSFRASGGSTVLLTP